MTILNTTNNTRVPKINKIKFEALSNYIIVRQNDTDRSQKLRTNLKKTFSHAQSDLMTKLCLKFTDIFGLETDTITTNNVYNEKLRLKDDEPSYVKNYRKPHSQQAEISKQVTKLVEDKIVEPSVSKYNSLLLLVPKKPLPNSKV